MLRWRVLRRRRRSDFERPRSGMVEGGGALRADAREHALRAWRAVSVARRVWRGGYVIWLLDGEWCSMANCWERLVEKCPGLRGEREARLGWRHSAVQRLLGGAVNCVGRSPLVRVAPAAPLEAADYREGQPVWSWRVGYSRRGSGEWRASRDFRKLVSQ